jgi:uncharacterized protein
VCAFAYGGFKQRLLHDPELPPVQHDAFEQYKANKGPTVNHCYAKLLLLTDRMNTATGSAHSRASPRHPRRVPA